MNATKVDLTPPDSRFGWVVSGKQRGPSDLFDVPVYRDEDAIAVPSIGSLVPGWTLVVPTKAAPSIAHLGSGCRQPLERARRAVTSTLTARFKGDVYEFEHGSAGYGEAMGCGVDQAHLHFVPLSFDLVAAAAKLNGDVHASFSGTDSDPWAAVPDSSSYWLIRNTVTGAGVIVIPRVAESQALRRLVAEQIGSSRWDYRNAPAPLNAELTRNAFASCLT